MRHLAAAAAAATLVARALRATAAAATTVARKRHAAKLCMRDTTARKPPIWMRRPSHAVFLDAGCVPSTRLALGGA